MNELIEKNLMMVLEKYGNAVVLHLDEFDELSRIYEKRSVNFGRGEANAVSSSVGFLVRGKIPVVVGGAGAVALIRDGICLPNMNVKFVIEGSDADVYKKLPNMKVIKCGNEKKLQSAMKEMMEKFGPYAILFSD